MMFWQRITLVTFLIVFFAHENFAQEKGRVLNIVSGFPVQMTAVFSSDQLRSSVADKDGYFDLSQFLPEDTVTFQHPAFVYRKLTIKEIKSLNNIIYLNPEVFLLEEFTVTAPNMRQNVEDQPNKVNFIDAKQIWQSTKQNSADLLTLAGDVVIQKTQGGGGSPILRGFEANKVLLVIDGIRLNNAIYRSGHLQNSLTVDPAILDQVSVIFGPTSILYGSDALGGVIYYKTKSPELSGSDEVLVNGSAYSQYATASNNIKGHLNLNIGGKKFASLSSFTYSKFGNITAGKWRNKDVEDDYGLVTKYIERIDGDDEVKTNNDPEQQIPTAYDQYDFMQKFRYMPNSKLELEANLQYSTSSDINRLDKLLTPKGEGLKYAEFGYGPQKRFLGALSSWYKQQTKLFTNVKTILAYQRIDEDRFKRKVGKTATTYQEEDVHVLSLNMDFLKIVLEENKLNYGIEFTHNIVDSKGYNKSLIGEALSDEEAHYDSRYPDGGSKTFSMAAYAAYNWLIAPGYTLNAGLRYSYSISHSEFTDAYTLPTGVSEIDIKDSAPTGSLSFLMNGLPTWQFNLVASSGFRTPNVDDYGKVREKDGDLTVPNNKVRSEYAYNLEATIQKDFTDELSIAVNGYNTWLVNAIVRQAYSPGFGVEGEDGNYYYDLDGDEVRLVTNMNADLARIWGVGATVRGDWKWGEFSSLKFNGTFNYTWGRNITNDEPLGHIAPVFGRVSLDYSDDKLSVGLWTFYNGLKKFEDMSPYAEDNDSFASGSAGGFPAWWTLNFRSNYRLNDYFRVQFAVDNIFDAHYRPFASPVAAAGRNFVFGLHFDF